MGKKLFTVLIVLSLCLPLTACGQKNEPASKNDDVPAAAETETPAAETIDVAAATDADSSDAGDETGEDEQDTIFTAGPYEHRIGDAVFYTKNDLNKWIDDDVFDFYGMMEDFGWTIYQYVQEENGYWVGPGPDLELGDSLVRLDDSGNTVKYDVVIGDLYGKYGFSIEMFESNGHMITTPNGRKIAYELCELLLYSMECIEDNPEYITADLGNLAKYLPSRVRIGVMEN